MMYSENDISNSIKNGILYLEDPVNHVSVESAGPAQQGRAGRAPLIGALCFLPGVVSPLLCSDQQ